MLVELSVVEQHYYAVMEVLSGGVPVVEVAERYGVSRKTVHAWLRRYRQDGRPKLTNRSHRPRRQPGQLAAGLRCGYVSCAGPIRGEVPGGWCMSCANWKWIQCRRGRRSIAC
jgi:uncharacterized protein YjcR